MRFPNAIRLLYADFRRCRSGLRAGLLLLSAFLLSPPVSNAQTHYRSNVSVGVKAGADISRVFFNPSVKQGMLPGAVAGLMFRYVEESHFGLVAELNLAQRGWSENFGGAPYSYKRTVSYLQLPVLAHIYFGRRGRFFFNAGPEIGLRLAEKTSCNFDPSAISTLPDFPDDLRQTDQLLMPVHQRVDYGITAGLGGEFSLNRRNALSLEARFYYGLGNLFPSGRRDSFRGSNTMAVEFTLGYWFRIR